MLSPQAEADEPGPAFFFGVRSREYYPAFVEELQDISGIDVGYCPSGVLWLGLAAEDEARVRARAAWQERAGFKVEMLAAEEARKLEPGLGEAVRCAAWIPGDHQVNARLLGRALAQAGARLGVQMLPGWKARKLLQRGGVVCGV